MDSSGLLFQIINRINRYNFIKYFIPDVVDPLVDVWYPLLTEEWHRVSLEKLLNFENLLMSSRHFGHG